MTRGAVLRVRDFRLLFAANTVSMIGNTFTAVALAFGVLDATGSTRDIGIVLAFRVIALVLLLIIGGAWADRVSRRTLLVQAAVVSGLTQAGIAALFLTHTGSLWSLSVLAAINGAASAFSQPATVGLLPEIVPADLLQDANALNSVMRNSATIGGAALAGVLVAVASPGWALAIDAVSFFIDAALILRISRFPPTASGEGLWTEIKVGWKEFSSRTWVWAIVVQFSIVNMAFTAAFDVYTPVVAKFDLGGPAAYGAISAALGVGGIGGGLMMLRFKPKRPLIVATIGISIALVMFALLAASAPLWAVIVAAGVSGIGLETFSVLWASSLQRHIPADRLSRVSAYDALGSFAFMPIGLALAGPLASAFGGVHNALWAAFVMMAVPTILIYGVKDVWRLRGAAEPAIEPVAVPSSA